MVGSEALIEETLCFKKVFLGLYLKFECSYLEPNSCNVMDLEPGNLHSNSDPAPYLLSDSGQAS